MPRTEMSQTQNGVVRRMPDPLIRSLPGVILARRLRDDIARRHSDGFDMTARLPAVRPAG